MMRTRSLSTMIAAAMLSAIPCEAWSQKHEHISVEIDATQLHRHLLTSKITIPVEDGQIALWFPKWIPGIHGPGEQDRNIGGLVIHTGGGERLTWTRDPVQTSRFLVDVPAGVKSIVADVTYLANQPTRTSNGVDTFGNALCSILSFNTAVLYPEGASADALQVKARVKLPAGWKHATALRTTDTDKEGWRTFEAVTLRRFIDSPLIAGEHMRTLDVRVPNFPPVFMHFVSESPSAIRFDPDLEDAFRKFIAESAALFRYAPFDEYHFLTICSDQLPSIGLEHLRSSLNVVGERGLVDAQERADWPAYLLPHEFVHAWNGKYRRPAPMATTDYHTDKQTHLLWVYEGLTQYLGEVLAIRSGIQSMDEHLARRLPANLGYLMNRSGRRWRSLEDTAASGHTLRGGSKRWNHLRRNQDYYNEGALFWMEADAIIRDETDNRRTLDDFCRAFFGEQPDSPRVGPVVHYDLDEVIDTLNTVAAHDWAGLIEKRIMRVQDELPLNSIERAGYRITWTASQPEPAKDYDKRHKRVSGEHSLGLTLDHDGTITDIVPGGVADTAGLAEEVRVIGVNGRKFSPERFRDALDDSTVKRGIELLTLRGDVFETVHLEYAGGLRYLTLTRRDGAADYLNAILRPLTD